MQSDYHPAYYDGKLSASDGYAANSCPYGMAIAGRDEPKESRENSECAKRHWWLAGWHDQKQSEQVYK